MNTKWEKRGGKRVRTVVDLHEQFPADGEPGEVGLVVRPEPRSADNEPMPAMVKTKQKGDAG